MHLRSLRLRGFKSFPEQLELQLEPGVAVVVGPNGSGKSNVADAIVWAAGSLTPSELRAEKPDDVLFNGAEGRKPADTCEVELVFENDDGLFGGLDYAEVSIARRLHRGGEGQVVAGLGGLAGRIKPAGEETQTHRRQEGAEHAAGDLVDLERIHGRDDSRPTMAVARRGGPP